MNKQLRGGLLLALAALIWGMAFSAQSEAGKHMGPFAFTAARSFITFFCAAALRGGGQPRQATRDAGGGSAPVCLHKARRAAGRGDVRRHGAATGGPDHRPQRRQERLYHGAVHRHRAHPRPDLLPPALGRADVARRGAVAGRAGAVVRQGWLHHRPWRPGDAGLRG